VTQINDNKPQRCFYLEEQQEDGSWKRSQHPYYTREAGATMKMELDEHGGCGPLRIVSI
jgi:hypothetical protein